MNPQSPPSPPSSSTSSIPWRKYAVMAGVGLTIVISWWQSEARTNNGPDENVRQVSAAAPSPEQTHALASRFNSDAASLSDQEYRAAALAQEAQMKRRRQQRQQQQQLMSVPTTTPHVRWQRQVNQLQASLVHFREFPQDSIQWHLRERLKQMLLEEPQR